MRWTTLVGVVLVFGGLSLARPASAQEVSPTLKGITGGALLGAEIPLMGMSLAGVTNGWALGLIPVATAAGGGVAGFFFVEEKGNAELAMAMLVGGMALVIPTIGLVVNATSYHPDESEGFIEVLPEEEFESEAGTEGETDETGASGGFHFGGSTGGAGGEGEGAEGGEAPAPPERRPPRPGPTGSLLLVDDEGALAWAVPTPTLVPPAWTLDGSVVVALQLASGTF